MTLTKKAALGGLAALLCLAALPAAGRAASTSGAWTLDDFGADITIGADAVLTVQETIRVTFIDSHHGIYRYVPETVPYNSTFQRDYAISILSVTREGVGPEPYSESDTNGYRFLKIGDPNLSLSGPQTYVITYTVGGALDTDGHRNELAWHVKGDQWEVPAAHVHATVHLPAGTITAASCLEGTNSQSSSCQASATGSTATYQSTGALAGDEDLRLAADFPADTLSVPPPALSRTFAGFWDVTPATVGTSLLVLLAGFGLVALAWWRRGRDLVYRSVYYQAPNPPTGGDTEIEPLGSHRPLVVEFEPPSGLRPAQLGLMLDEEPDTKDVTATIIDFASRGYLTISQTASSDWLLTRNAKADWRQLSAWEQVIFDGLFGGREQVSVSELKGKFRDTLAKAEKALTDDAMGRGWFTANPTRVVWLWRGLGLLVVLAGAALAFGLGLAAGFGLVGVAAAVVGLVVIVIAHAMPRRSAAGSEVLQKTLGFRLFMTTAERYRAQFAEKQDIFTTLLPYAIVFGCCDLWAAAFKDIAANPPSWYMDGRGAFNAVLFSASLQSFSNGLAASVTYVPPSTSGGGFGGFSGGGGGGGGGAW